MRRYRLGKGTVSGLRVVDQTTGETAHAADRELDNMTQAAAKQAIVLLDHLSELRRGHHDSAVKRNDLVALLEENSRPD